MTTRREFVGAAGAAGAAALALAARPAWATLSADDRIKTLGAQLYTVRDALQANFDDTLDDISATGYREVEFAGYMGKTPQEVKQSLKAAGLKAPATHLSLEALVQQWGPTVEAAHTIGIQYLVVPWIDADQRKTLDDYRRLANGFNTLGRQCHGVGLRLAYHNHAFEFAPIDGQVPYDILLEGTDPSLVAFEMDLYWITEGGADPLAYFAKYPGRFPMVHVKDRTADGQMVDVGNGVINWAQIFSHRKQAGIKHYFVEHDDPKDPFASLTVSYDYLNALRFTDA
jgi:sugar phosphate isomerase/epimerase